MHTLSFDGIHGTDVMIVIIACESKVYITVTHMTEVFGHLLFVRQHATQQCKSAPFSYWQSWMNFQMTIQRHTTLMTKVFKLKGSSLVHLMLK